MKYYIFTTEMRVGGVERVISLLAERWSRDSMVTIIILRDEVEYSLPAAVRIITLDLATGPLHFYSGLLAWRALRRTRTILAENDEPFVFFSFLEMPNFISVLLKRKFPNGIFIGGTRNNLSMYSRVFNLLYPCYKQLDAVIVNSRANRRLYIERFGLPAKKVVFIHNPIDYADIKRQAAGEIPYKLMQLKGRNPIIIAVGRLVKTKNYALLLRAFARLPRENTCAHLVILGDGPERFPLQRLADRLGIANRLTMPGTVRNPYVWMAHANLFVHSSNYEGCPNVLIEAMAIGLPIVACDCPTGPAEILQNGALGILVPTNDVEALAAAIARALPREKTQYPFLRDWDADIVADRFRIVIKSISVRQRC